MPGKDCKVVKGANTCTHMCDDFQHLHYQTLACPEQGHLEANLADVCNEREKTAEHAHWQ